MGIVKQEHKTKHHSYKEQKIWMKYQKKNPTMHTCKDLAQITGRSDQNADPSARHGQNTHRIFRIRLQNNNNTT